MGDCILFGKGYKGGKWGVGDVCIFYLRGGYIGVCVCMCIYIIKFYIEDLCILCIY